MPKLSVSITVPVTKAADDVNGRRFLVANHGKITHGGSVTVFAQKDSAKAEKALRAVKVGDTVNLVNIGIASGKVYVFDDSTVQVAS